MDPWPLHSVGLVISFADTDEMRWLTRTVAIGSGMAVVLALTGGMPFALPMPTHAIGLVDPTCGLTRASIAMARGDLVSAWRFNPVGAQYSAVPVDLRKRRPILG